MPVERITTPICIQIVLKNVKEQVHLLFIQFLIPQPNWSFNFAYSANSIL